MAVDITVRHMETPESVSRYARTKSEDLMAAFPRPIAPRGMDPRHGYRGP